MPTTNYDASELTRYRNARVLFSFKQQLINEKVNMQCIPEQGLPALNGVFVQRFTGGFPRIIDGITKVGNVIISAPIPSGNFIRSKNNITDGGFTIGGPVDIALPPPDDPEASFNGMGNELYTYEFDPSGYQVSFFPGMANFINENIVLGDKSEENRLIASYWNDLGNDIFDNWGFFYLYDVQSGKYYFPLLDPQNQDDGIITTQTFNAFGRTFTIKHGWAVQGIFKFDISVNDNLPFRFGGYGNMGSDGDEFTEDLVHPYSINGTNLILYYHHHEESDNNFEKLYSYFIPKNVPENASKSYDIYYEYEANMSAVSKEVTNGLLVYFAKTNDVKDWVVNDLEFGAL
jgi:hypothetical protein